MAETASTTPTTRPARDEADPSRRPCRRAALGALTAGLTLAAALALAAGLPLTADAAQAADRHPWNEALPFEQATIVYELTGTTAGTETLYLRAYGDRRARVSKTTNPSVPYEPERDTLDFETPQDTIRIELGTKTGMRMPSGRATLIEGYKALPPEQQANVRRAALSVEYRFPAVLGHPEIATKEKFMGFDCDVVTMAGVRQWYIAGTDVILKADGVSGNFVIHRVVASIDTKTPVPDSVFVVPDGIPVRDMRGPLGEVTRSEAKRQLEAMAAGKPK